MLNLEFAECSDRGRVRRHNEDCVGHCAPVKSEQVRTRGWLFALADGVGGQARGEVASRLAVEIVLAEFANAPEGESHIALLARAFQAANTQVYEAAHGEIATTLVACALRFDRAVVAHAGDSRCYLIRHGRPRLLTRDHTVAAEQARMGLLSEEAARTALTRSVLSRSVGHDLFLNSDVSEHRVIPGDLLLLCSDGLHGAVPDEEIARIASSTSDLKAASEQLIAIANQRDGGDNVSVQLVRIRSVERVGMYRGRPYRLH